MGLRGVRKRVVRASEEAPLKLRIRSFTRRTELSRMQTGINSRHFSMQPKRIETSRIMLASSASRHE
jgi:hypothetical protein